MEALGNIVALLFFPGGLFVIFAGLMYEWVDHKIIARTQNRIGPRWFQPFADTIKLLSKEEIVPDGANPILFVVLPLIALAGALTASLYVPMAGLDPAYSFPGDLIVTVYMLSLLTLSIGLAGANAKERFSLVGSTRALTQLFAYEAPFLLALLGPAIAAGSWQISEIIAYTETHMWMMILQPIGFVVALIGLMGKLELPPFDSPEAKTEIVAGSLTEYSGRGYAIFHMGKAAELIIGLTLITAFYMGGVSNPLWFLLKTISLLVVLAALQSLMTRLRIDQTVGMWWRYGALLVLLQWLIIVVVQLI